MATLVKTPSGTWKAVIRKTGWPTCSKSFRTKRDAEDWARRTEDEMVRGVYIERSSSERMTLEKALNRYLAEVSRTPHHLGRLLIWEWKCGANSWRLGESKVPTARASVGASSIAPIVLPQTGQKARLDHSEERQVEGCPPGPVQRTCSRSNSTHICVSDPECRWHWRQEQVCGSRAGPVAV